MIEVTLEPIEMRTEPAEKCAFCNQESRHWWSKGILCVCKECAAKMSDDDCKVKAEALGRLPYTMNNT